MLAASEYAAIVRLIWCGAWRSRDLIRSGQGSEALPIIRAIERAVAHGDQRIRILALSESRRLRIALSQSAVEEPQHAA